MSARRATLPGDGGRYRDLDNAHDFDHVYNKWPSSMADVAYSEVGQWAEMGEIVAASAAEVIAERDKRIEELEERIADLEAELAGARGEQ